MYVRELLKFGIDKPVVNDSLSVCFCVLIRSIKLEVLYLNSKVVFLKRLLSFQENYFYIIYQTVG